MAMSVTIANRQPGSAFNRSGADGIISAKLTAPPQSPQTARGTVPAAAAVVTLSDTAKSALDGLKAAQEATADATRSFDEQLKVRSETLAGRLSAAFSGEGIPVDEPIALRMESGRVVSDSPYRKKIEKLFGNDPELAKEFESVASLKAMQAAQKSLELYNQEKKNARDRNEQNAAYERHSTRMIDIQKLSGVMTLKDGALSSAAEDYMGVMSGAVPTASDPRGEVLKRYGSILRISA
ncbi:hypothetical protein [Methylorubrum populi]